MMLGFDVARASLSVALVLAGVAGLLCSLAAAATAALGRRSGRLAAARGAVWLGVVGVALGVASLGGLSLVAGPRVLIRLPRVSAYGLLAVAVGVAAVLLGRRAISVLAGAGALERARELWSQRAGRRRAAVLVVCWIVWAGAALVLCSPLFSRGVPQVRPLPVLAATAPARVYVSHRAQDAISVIDTASRRAVAAIPVSAPETMAVSPDGSRLYVGSGDGIAIIDTRTLAIVARVRLPADAAPAVSPDGARLYAMQDRESSRAAVNVVDSGTGAVVATVPIDMLAAAAAVSPDGLRLYMVHHFYSAILSVLDTTSLATGRLTSVEDGSSSLALSRDGRHAYVPNGSGSNGRVTTIAAETGAVTRSIALGEEPGGVVMTPDGERLYVSGFRTESVAVVDPIRHRVLQRLPVPRYPTRLAISPDGATLWVLHNTSEDVTVIDTADHRVSQVRLGAPATHIASPPPRPDLQALAARRAAYDALSTVVHRLRALGVATFALALATGLAFGLWLRGRERSTLAALPVAALIGLLSAAAVLWGAGLAMHAGSIYVEHRWPLSARWPVLAALSSVLTVEISAASLVGWRRARAGTATADRTSASPPSAREA